MTNFEKLGVLQKKPKGILVFQTFSIARTEISDVDKLVKIYMVGSSTTCITAFREKSLFE